MPKSANQKLKLLYLKDILETYTDENNMLSTQQLIDMLDKYGINAERKSIYDDIIQLESYGVDIVTEKKKSNCYYIGSRVFELPELKLLVDSIQSSKFLTRKKSEQLIKKIETLCSKNEATQLQRQVFVSNRIKNMNESIYYIVDEIHNAIISNRQISFKYKEYTVSMQQQYKRNGELYVISPYALIWNDENYYLLGFDSKNNIFKHYRVDKIDNISMLEEKRSGYEQFNKIDLSKYDNKFFSMYGGTEEKVKLRFSNDLVGVVIDRFGKDIRLIKTDDNHFEVYVDIVVSSQFFGWLASLGCNAIIISPQTAVDGFKEHLSNVIKQY